MFERENRWQQGLTVLGVLFLLGIVVLLVWQRQRIVQRAAQRAPALPPALPLPSTQSPVPTAGNSFASANAQNQLWVVADNGLHVWQNRQHQWVALPQPDLQLQSVATSAIPAALWLGTLNHGLWQWDGQHWLAEPLAQDPPIYKIQVDAQGVAWVASANGVWRKQAGQWQHYAINDAPETAVFDLALDAAGQLWVIHAAGIYQWQPATEQFVLAAPASLFPASLTSVFFDREQELWVGFLGGIARYHTQQWQQWTPAALAQQPITTFWADGENTVFVGTAAGVWYWQAAAESPLPLAATETLAVRSIAPNAQGGLWLGSQRGVWLWHNAAFPARLGLLQGD